MNGISPIQTRYGGCLFRSRIEARWAVFFDWLKIDWEYEKEGFFLSDGRGYLPDFWLPKQKMWLEIKGEYPAEDDVWYQFTKELSGDSRAELAYGPIPDPTKLDNLGSDSMIMRWAGEEGEDYHYQWCRCHLCGSFDVQFDGRGARNYCRIYINGEESAVLVDCQKLPTGCWHDGDRCHAYDHPFIKLAYEKARSYRFEPRAAGLGLWM